MSDLPFMSLNEAQKYMGVSHSKVEKLIKEGKLKPEGKIGRMLVFSSQSVELCRQRYTPHGKMSHADIARKYGMARRTVIMAFGHRLRVRPDAIFHGGAYYDERTVEKFAKILGWEPVEGE